MGYSSQLPGDFFITSLQQSSPEVFIEALRQLVVSLHMVPAELHLKQHLFVFKDLATCFHVFKSINSIKKLVEQPCTDPYRVIRSLDGRN